MEREIFKYDLSIDYLIGEGDASGLSPKYVNFPCKIEAGFFIFCSRGTMKTTINTNTYHIKENDLITLPPNYFMEICEFSPDIRIYYAAFSSRFIESINLMKSTQHLLPVIMENPVVSLSAEDAHSYKLFYESSIFAYKSSHTRDNKEVVKAVLTMFVQGATEIYKLKKNWTASFHSRKYEVYQEFMKLVMKHYTVHHSTSFYAQEMRLSLPHFCSTIKKVTGNTPSEVIASVILMEVKARLKFSGEPVKTIALAVGFSNLSFFNKFFKHHTGMTPQEYRES